MKKPQKKKSRAAKNSGEDIRVEAGEPHNLNKRENSVFERVRRCTGERMSLERSGGRDGPIKEPEKHNAALGKTKA